MKRLVLAFAAALTLISAPALAQNVTPPSTTDLIMLTRKDANGVGTPGAVPVASAFNTAGIGYSAGGGGAVTQLTSRTTGVTLNTLTGAITLVSAAGSTTATSFTVTNSTVAATDVILLSQKSGTDTYRANATSVGAGSFVVTFATNSGTTTEQPVFNFVVIKGAAS